MVRGLRGLGDSRGVGGIGGLKPYETADDVATAGKTSDQKFARWVATVGESRAREAMDVARSLVGHVGIQSGTLPELLAEAWLRKQQLDYISQFDLIWARPDFVVFGVEPMGAVVLRVQGDYWHGSADAMHNDANQADQLVKVTARGLPILRVADAWESKIYASEAYIGDVLYERV